MMSSVVAGVIDAIKGAGIECQDIGFKDLIDGTVNLKKSIGLNVTIEQSPVSSLVTLYDYKWRFNLSVKVVVQHLQGGNIGQGRRKEKIYDTLEAISQVLMIQKLGLDLENPLTPLSFKNITSNKLARAGYQVYELVMWGSYIQSYTEPQDQDGKTLVSIDNKYWLMPNDSTNFSDSTNERAEDLIIL